MRAIPPVTATAMTRGPAAAMAAPGGGTVRAVSVSLTARVTRAAGPEAGGMMGVIAPIRACVKRRPPHRW